MNNYYQSYVDLIEEYVSGGRSWQSFREDFENKYLSDNTMHSEDIFQILDWLWAEAAQCTSDPELLSKHPDMYVDQAQLYTSAKESLVKLKNVLKDVS